MKQKASFNDLSHDLFFEIFDYLDVFDLFKAFFNLNQRFNLLIIDRHNCFHANLVKLNSYELSIYKSLILPKIACYIRYLSISDELNYLQIILRSISFSNLLSVKLYHVKLNELKQILSQCQLKYLLIDTNHIQNERHLNEIFKTLLNHQLVLRSLQCNFYTNLHFIEEKNKLSKLRRVIIDCDCSSSDFIILISQLPEIRHLNARINDNHRKSMEKDVDNMTGNESVRSLILHIENVELDRLLLIFSIMPNVHILELNGTIDFDINHLLEYERNYTSFRCNIRHHRTF